MWSSLIGMRGNGSSGEQRMSYEVKNRLIMRHGRNIVAIHKSKRGIRSTSEGKGNKRVTQPLYSIH